MSAEARKRIEDAISKLPPDASTSHPVCLSGIDVLDVFLTGDDDKPHFDDDAHAACAYLSKAAAKTGAPEINPPVGKVREALRQLAAAAPKPTKPPGGQPTGDAK